MENFARAFDALLDNEGGYSDQPSDPGGKTMWGVTEAVARQAGYQGDMKDLPQSVAQEIYRREYWFPALDKLPYDIAFNLFDGSVNHGKATAVKILQRSLGLKEDGKFGPATLAATLAKDPVMVVVHFNAARIRFYTSLPTWRDFGRGWANRVAGNLEKMGK